jgi:hypothetical protein
VQQDDELQEMDIDADGGADEQENTADDDNIMPTEEQANFQQPRRASKYAVAAIISRHL